MPSSDAFGYEYLLTIGRNEQLLTNIVRNSPAGPILVGGPEADPLPASSFGTSTGSTTSLDFRTVPSKSFNVFDKQMTAEIDNTKDTVNPAVISVYNLTDEQISLIGDNTSIILRAGYRTEIEDFGYDRNQLPLVYVGQVISSNTVRDGIDRITRIVCSDGKTVFKNIKLSISWPPGTPYLNMLLDLETIAGQAGLPRGRIEGDLQNTTLLNKISQDGYQLSGILGEQLIKFCDMIGYRVYTVLGKLHFEPKYADPSIDVVNITSQNIKGTIDIEQDSRGELSATPAEKKGIILKTYLNGNITSNKILRLSRLLNKDLEGDYKITSTKHSMNYEGDVWHTEIHAARIK